MMAEQDLRARFPEANLKLDDDQLAIIERFATPRVYRNGQTIIKVGARDSSFYVIRSGEVEAIEYSTGKPQIIWRSYPKELVGDVSFLSGRASNLSRVAKGDVEVLQLSPENLRRIIDEIPKLGNVILSTLIARIQIMHDLNFTPVRVIGSKFSSDAFRIRDFLAKNRVSFTWVDLENHSTADELLERLKVSEADIPVVACSSDWMLSNPSNKVLAERLGILVAPKEEVYDLAVIGAGPAGLTAAVNGSSEGMRTIVLERTATGGQAGTSSMIENYPGFPMGLSGNDLAARITLQAQKFGAQISTPCDVHKLEFENGYPILHLDDGTRVSAKCLLIATGASYSRLGIDGGTRFEGAGIYYTGAPLDARMYSDSQVVVVGGGNSGGEAAVFLAEHVRAVVLVIRDGDLKQGMSRYLSRRIEQTENIEILTNTEIMRLNGDGHLESLELKNNRTGETRVVNTPALFTFIGATPRTDWLPEEIETDEKGFIKTGHAAAHSHFWTAHRQPLLLETTRPGVFAAGDVRSGSIKRVASAVGEGAIAVASVREYFKHH